jgi:hypothetical protein
MMPWSKKKSLKGNENGRRAFILGNGPSIIKEDLAKLKGELIIGMNASTILEKEFGFFQNYYCISDSRFLCHPEKRMWGTSELDKNTIRVLRGDLIDLDDPNLKKSTYYTPHLKRDGFSYNVEVGFYYGCTTTMLAIQLAAHLGCSEIYLLGVDLRYRHESPRFYKESKPQLEDAFTSVQIWNIANAAKILSNSGCRLISCSEKSLLRPYLPYFSLESFL